MKSLKIPMVALLFLFLPVTVTIPQQQDSSAMGIQTIQSDSTQATSISEPSTGQKSWFEEHQTLGGAIIGGAVTLLVGLLGLIGFYIKRRTKAELEGQQEFEQELKKIASDETERRYFRGVEAEHGSINLYGFQSTANVKVRTLDVFVSLRLSHYRRDGMPEMREEIEEDGHHLTPEKVLMQAFRKNRSLLIVGDPGSGKTTLLKYYAMCCLDQSGRKKLALNKPLIPIILPLRKVDPQKPFSEALSAWATTKNYGVSAELFDQWLEKRGALVMLDGLDEISEVKKRKKVCDWVDNACHAYRNSKFVVTSRFTGYRVAEGIELQSDHLRGDVLDLDRQQQATFLKKWFTAAYRDDLEVAEQSRQEKQLDLREEADDLSKAVIDFLYLEENAGLRQLAGTPVLLQIMAILWKEYGSLASGRAALYEKCTDYLLDRRDRVRNIIPLLPAEQAKIVLRPIALWMQETLKTDEVAKPKLEKRLAPRLEEVKPGLKPEDFVKNLLERAGILQEFGDEGYIFRHKSFREFLAASQLAEEVQRKPNRVQVLVDNFNSSWWRETLLFALTLPKPVIFPDFMQRFLPHKHNSAGFPPLLQQIVKEAPQKSIEPFEKFVLDSRRHWQKRYNALQCVGLIGSVPAQELVRQVREQEKKEKLKNLAIEILIEWQELEPVLEKGIDEFVELKLHEKKFYNPIERNAEYILIPGGKFTYSVTKKETEVP
ncbi:NACHT domain-containing protein, partial [candidate division KSB1 bacterium]|nr:NACHT domain-containing protein [candidate division KSB1 bacterium]NIR71402.1 NACHT domain-containing protein [candidate division KSB1 bacterium]NIS26296.1 NACHT domain-containing protein [candidate division KSB1 bacterium]NIT73059.1 NACHT domain-containing protein [candidate division KSB1 bacterium]NIU26966.1 NACHT domain-containing protein [candidate division KSB1 bacterium]